MTHDEMLDYLKKRAAALRRSQLQSGHDEAEILDAIAEEIYRLKDLED